MLFPRLPAAGHDGLVAYRKARLDLVALTHSKRKKSIKSESTAEQIEAKLRTMGEELRENFSSFPGVLGVILERVYLAE
jgi:hypothetical protein